MATALINFDSLLSHLNDVIGELNDPRKASNASTYSLKDIVLGAFGCFFMQSASFLDYQRHLDSRNGRNSAQSLFGLTRILSVEHIRNILAAEGLFEVCIKLYQALHQQGYLRGFETLNRNLLVALDGTDYYSLQKISCPCCSKRTARNGQVTYSPG